MDFVDYILNKKFNEEEKQEKVEELFSKKMNEIQEEIDVLVEYARSIRNDYEDEYGYIFYIEDYLYI